MASSYGRQWIHPQTSNAFANEFLYADRLATEGNIEAAYRIYKTRSKFCDLSRRRLEIARKQILKATDSTIQVAFIDWYPNHQKDINFVKRIFEESGLKLRITSVQECDLIIASPYGHQLLTQPKISKDKLVLFISGENLAPSYNIHDFSWSTRRDTYCGKNVRLPQWYSEFNISKGWIEYIGETMAKSHLPNNRDIQMSVIYNNSTPEREQIIAILRETFGNDSVQVFGSHRGNHVNKMEILARSKINICFENSIGNGYVTEKLLHSKMMKCKALYWGDIYAFSDFSNKEVFNCYINNSQHDIIQWCKSSIEKTIPTMKMVEVDETIFESYPTLEPVKAHLRNWTGLILNWRKHTR